jgi:hypothetical protein
VLAVKMNFVLYVLVTEGLYLAMAIIFIELDAHTVKELPTNYQKIQNITDHAHNVKKTGRTAKDLNHWMNIEGVRIIDFTLN